MKKLFPLIVFTLVACVIVAPITYANHFDHMDDYNRDSTNRYENIPTGNSQFHPQDPDYYDGNLRYTLKTRSKIEHASSTNMHYDEYKRDYYRCNWVYNKNLDSWVCEKDYGRTAAQPVQVCPVGYSFSAQYQTCLSGNQPQPVVTKTVQPVQYVEVKPTITYYTYGENPAPVVLPSTGPATNWVLFMLALGGITSFSLSRTRGKNKQ